MYYGCSTVLLKVLDTCIKSRQCVKEINLILERSEEHTVVQGLSFRTTSPNNEYQWFNVHRSTFIIHAGSNPLDAVFLSSQNSFLMGFNAYGKRL